MRGGNPKPINPTLCNSDTMVMLYYTSTGVFLPPVTRSTPSNLLRLICYEAHVLLITAVCSECHFHFLFARYSTRSTVSCRSSKQRFARDLAGMPLLSASYSSSWSCFIFLYFARKLAFDPNFCRILSFSSLVLLESLLYLLLYL